MTLRKYSETQGKKPYTSGDPGSRGSSSEQTEPDKPLQRPCLEKRMGSSNFNLITTNFHSVNFGSISGLPYERSGNEAHKPDIASFPPEHMTNQNNDTRVAPSQFGEVCSEGGSASFTSYTTTPQLPLLKIPEDYTPGLSYTREDSSWCSSASDSTYSTQSDGLRDISQWSHSRFHSYNSGSVNNEFV